MRRIVAVLAIVLAMPAAAADYPKPQEGNWVARDFRFHAGEVMPELKLHYRTIGDPRNPAVLILHGTSGSGGGMHAWLWAGKYPDYMDAAVPMASQPTPMAARNWMMRRLIIDSIRNDPDWNGGNYTGQPRSAQRAAVFYATATSGGTLAYAALAPTRAAADKMLEERLAAPFTADANDYLHQWQSSADYDPTPLLPRITAKVLLINSVDDERNPPETGLTEKAMKQVRSGSAYLIPASPETRGHGTTGNATFYARPIAEFLQDVPSVR
jgi:homoserine O-acetyltransferase/O-succinyltransferase